MKVLIADDNKQNLDLLEAVLKGGGYEVVRAQNGEEALARLLQEPVDLIISDILMPKMDGFQLCLKCKKDEKLKNTPFIMATSSYTDKVDEELCLKLGADKFLVRPMGANELLKLIAEVLEKAKKEGVALQRELDETSVEFLRSYNERVVRQLEKKMMELEEDIAKREQAENKLRIFSSVVEQSTEGMAIAGLDGKLTFVNEAWRRMHGYESSEELVGQSLAIFHNKEQLEKDVEPFNKKVKELGAYSGEVGHVTKDGKPFPTLMATAMLKDAQGKPYALAGIAKDITERKQAEEQLRNKVLELQQIADAVVGRELKMIELEKEVDSLLQELGRPLKYSK